MVYRSCFKDDLLKGCVALVTGGATGIGRAIAYDLGSLGATVVLASRTTEKLSKTAAEIQKSIGSKGTVDYVKLNIRSSQDIYAAIQEVLKRHGKLTHLVNNAGGQFLSPAELISEKGWKSVIDLNLNGTFMMCKAAFELYMKEHGGSIVNITVANANGFPFMAHSGAARAGVENMSKTLAVEWGTFGVRVNCVASGTLIGSGMKNYPVEAQVQVTKEVPQRTVLGRLGTEAEIASCVVFLCSPASAYVTGDAIKADGGITLQKYLMKSESEPMNGTMFLGFDSIEEAVGNDAPPMFKELLQKYQQKSKL